MSPRRPLRNTVCGNVLICRSFSAIPPICHVKKTQISLQAVTALSFFSRHCKRSMFLPALVWRKLPLWPISYNYLFFVTKYTWAPVVAKRQLEPVQELRDVLWKINLVHFTTEPKVTYKEFGEAYFSNQTAHYQHYQTSGVTQNKKKKTWLTFSWIQFHVCSFSVPPSPQLTNLDVRRTSLIWFKGS